MNWLVLTFVAAVTVALVCGLGHARRQTFGSSARMRTLEEEVGWLRVYAEVLRARHGTGLRFRWAITPKAARMLFPRFVLQPLLEDAVMHGMAKGAGRSEISVRAALAGDRGHGKTLVCTVEDDVPVSRPSAADGLRALRRVLTLQCKGARLHVEASSEGTRSTIEVRVPTTR